MARATGPSKVHRYTAEFKLKAVKLSELNGVQVQDVTGIGAGVAVATGIRSTVDDTGA